MTGLEWLPQQLRPIAYRLARADDHTYAIAELVSAWSAGAPLQIRTLRRNDGTFRAVVGQIRPIPPEVSLQFSEAIGHMRAALDNVVWHLVQAAQGALTDTQSRQVAMPIYDSVQDYGRRIEALKGRFGLACFSESEPLGERIRALQPFSDPSAEIESIGALLAALAGASRELVHPLVLLQDYSNEDKHRSIRLAAARAATTTFDRPVWEQDRTMRPVEQGQVLLAGMWGVRVELETNCAALVQRAGRGAAWVSPVKELSQLRRYVGDVAIPTLVTGSPIDDAFPPDVDLTDTGLDWGSRMTQASGVDAEQRFAPRMREMLTEALTRPASWPEPEWEPDDGEAG